jgi:hypothetical protein
MRINLVSKFVPCRQRLRRESKAGRLKRFSSLAVHPENSWINGNVDVGILPAGQISGLVKDILSVKRRYLRDGRIAKRTEKGIAVQPVILPKWSARRWMKQRASLKVM